MLGHVVHVSLVSEHDQVCKGAKKTQCFSQIPIAVRVQSLFAGQMANAPMHAFAEVSTNDAAAALCLANVTYEV